MTAPPATALDPGPTGAAPSLQPVDVSPGTLGKLAFLQDGDLWVKALPDGTARKLASGTSGAPRWSPSGDWLLVDRTVLRADGSSERDGEGCKSWSPAADELVCIVQDQGLAVENADGSERRSIDLGATPRGALWSPDGTKIAYTVDDALDTSRIPYSRVSSLWVINEDGSGALDIYDSQGYARGDQVGVVEWSRDGSELVFALIPSFSASALAGGLRLYVLPADGGKARKLDGTALLHGELLGGFSSRGSMAVTEGRGRETWTDKRVASVDPASGTLTYLTGPESAALSPAWSQNGRHIAYVSGPDIGPIGGGDPAKAAMAQRRIWLMNADGSNKRQLTDDDAYRDERPLWSVNGPDILFARIDNGDETTSLWLIAAAGCEPAKVADISALQADTLWFGFYGYIAWDRFFDWWQEPAAKDP